MDFELNIYGSVGMVYAMQVDDTSAELIMSQLLLLDAEDQTKDIKLFINSPGGSITAGVFSRFAIARAYSRDLCVGS